MPKYGFSVVSLSPAGDQWTTLAEGSHETPATLGKARRSWGRIVPKRRR